MCRRNCGGSNDLNRMKIEPRKRAASDYFISYWPKDSINWAKKIGIKTATFQPVAKSSFRNRFERELSGK